MQKESKGNSKGFKYKEISKIGIGKLYSLHIYIYVHVPISYVKYIPVLSPFRTNSE